MSNILKNVRINCYKCKGDLAKCHPHRCPQRVRAFALNQVRVEYKNKVNLGGDNPPSFFVGSTNWPNITISPMISLDTRKSDVIDEPDKWQTKYQIPQIVNFRTHLIRAQGRRIDARTVEKLNDRLLTTSQELVLASNPVYTTFKLAKPINYSLSFNKYTQPIGPKSKVLSFTVEDTPKIDRKVDYYTSDTDLLARDAITNLYSLNLSVTRINRILSAGLLGTKGTRKLVPTRWAITATDDIVGKELINKIKNYPEIDDYRVYTSSYLDNHFVIFMMPKLWAYEFLEGWGESSITGDFETNKGRTKYASNSAGGYYASRVAILEYLERVKKQAEVFCWRFIGEGYYLPLGVWQVRENVRSAFSKNEYKSFDSKTDLYSYLNTVLHFTFKTWKSKSFLLNIRKQQLQLSEFL
jgi:hypothetical protein